MTRNLRALGLALLAFAALGATIASAAQAEFFAEAAPVKITGEQNLAEKHEFSTVAGTVKCSTSKFQGEAKEKTEKSLTLNPTYTGCTIAGIGATVSMKSCYYTFTVEKTTETDVDLSVHVLCNTAGDEIEVSVVGSTCKVKIPPQTLTGITAKNIETGGRMEVSATINVANIEYTIENGSKCPNAPANGKYNNGTYKGGVTLQGENPSTLAPIGITVT